MPSGTFPKEGECQPCREPPYSVSLWIKSPDQLCRLGLWGSVGPDGSHPTPHLQGHSPGPAESLPGDQGEIARHRALQGWRCGSQPGFGMSTGQWNLCRAAAAGTQVPLGPGWALSGMGVPAPAQHCGFHSVFWSVLTRRGVGGPAGGMSVNGLRAFPILENRKLWLLHRGFTFCSGGERPNCSA